MKKQVLVCGLSGLLVTIAFAGVAVPAQKAWKVHDKDRPQPKEVTPGDKPGDPPSDAIILLDGKDLSKWECGGGPAKWKVENGAMTIVSRSGSIQTKQRFGDCQLHIEWKAIAGTHSNSGVFFMGQYELQIFDSYKNKQWIYADGVAASMYGQHPPLVNVCRRSGAWQSFDVVFRAPRFDKDGKLLRPGTVTALHNGVLVLDNAKLKGFTVHGREAKYRPHPPKMPLMLQDHGNPVSFRNIWIRPLPE